MKTSTARARRKPTTQVRIAKDRRELVRYVARVLGLTTAQFLGEVLAVYFEKYPQYPSAFRVQQARSYQRKKSPWKKP